MNKVSLFLSLFISIECFSQPLPKDIQSVISHNCDSQYVFSTILKSNKLKSYFPQSTFNKFYDEKKHLLKLNMEYEKQQFFKAINDYYQKAPHKNDVIATIHHWCKENQYLNSLSDDPELPPTAILYNSKLTRPLFDKYFKLSSPNQSWYSLSSYELYELNVDYMNYTERLLKNELINLHMQLETTKKELLKKHGTSKSS